jgi:DNA invertase Pin-like site-specific DNA recombinase
MAEATQRALIYCRQSLTADEDDSLSLHFQERESRQLAARKGWAILEPPILDPDMRGWDPLRPGIRTLLERVEAERADVVIVYAMSRFARDYILQETIWRQLQERGARLVSVHEPHAEDDLVRGILGVVSQADRRRMGAFLSSSFRERARRGLPHGKTPFGFVKDGDGRLVPDPDTAPWALRAVEYLEAGWSLWRVARAFDAEQVAGRTWEPNVIRNMVRAPAIAGGVRCADVVTWDAHEAIIDRDRWERLQVMLDTRVQTRQKSEPSWLEGLILCGCGAPMYLVTDRHNYDPPKRQFRCAASPTRPAFQRRTYPACTFTPRSIMHHAAEAGTIAALAHDLTHLLDAETAYRHARERFAAVDGDGHRERQRLTRAREKAADERERLLVLYRRGSLDVERWEREDTALADRLAGLDADLAALPVPPDRAAFAATRLQLDGLAGMVAQIAAIDPASLRPILTTTGATVQRTRAGVRIVWPEPFAAMMAD